jgi:uncharacterized membrane protein YgcG
MTVRETISVRSEGSKILHGIYRDFPVRYKDRFGNRYVVGFEVIGVLKNDAPEPYHIKNISNGKRVYIGHKDVLIPPGEYIYTFVYKTNRQLGFFKDHDELYWNVTGNGWEFPIDQASASVFLPRETSGKILFTEGYTGPFGDRGKDFISQIDSSGFITFVTTRPLNEYEGLTIVVAWPKGIITEPDIVTKMSYFFSDNKRILTAISGLLLIILYYLTVWMKVGRDPEQGTIVTRYTPPENMSPAVMRYITNMAYDDRTFASALINMAVKGHLKITDNDGEYTIQRKDGGRQSMAPEEDLLMKKLLGSQRELEFKKTNHQKIRSAIDALRNHLSLKFEKIYFITNVKYFVIGILLTLGLLIANGISEALSKDMLPVFLFIILWLTIWSFAVAALSNETVKRWKYAFKNRDSTILRKGGAISMTFFTIPFVAGEIFGLAILWFSTSLFMILFLLTTIGINYLFGQLLKAPTLAGRKILDAIDGFKRFLTATEKDRLNMLNPPDKTPDLFEKYLPYALALNIEQEWAEQFADVLSSVSEEKAVRTYSPSWYYGTVSGLSAGEFTSSVGNSLSDAISASSTPPGSRSGGGGGGGGSSGGGGGGGGGGGW